MQISALQRVNSKKQKFLAALPFRHMIVDESHGWVRGQPGNISNQLQFFRSTLLRRAQTVFLLSGTPFVGNMCFDMIETIKSIATPARRSKWYVKFHDEDGSDVDPSYCYTDEKLEELKRNWDSTSAKQKTEMLAPLLLMRTALTEIDGVPIMPNYLAQLVENKGGEISYKTIEQEIIYRKQLLEKYTSKPTDNNGRKGANSYVLGRWLSYSPLLFEKDWIGRGRDNAVWWSGFSLADATRFERGRRLYKLLEGWRLAGKKPIVFATSVFQQQFAAQVPLVVSTTENYSFLI
jgi:hypothetical protein